ncbi:hypothetical protein [Saccharopolyspora spinosa]|uniref:hypothetical protein n=1 Tax=Saccharopolyspora spinosa TaxID=60894 RepID=UPI0005C8ED5A|nr:hypothetical protein [Saccharopolyspora spinosa]
MLILAGTMPFFRAITARARYGVYAGMAFGAFALAIVSQIVIGSIFDDVTPLYHARRWKTRIGIEGLISIEVADPARVRCPPGARPF